MDTTDKIRQYNRKLLALQSAGAAIASVLDPHTVWETVTEKMTGLLEVSACAAFEWKPGAEEVNLQAHFSASGCRHVGPTLAHYHLADHPPKECALLERYPQQIQASQPHLGPATSAYMREANARTLLLLPMLCQDRAVGLIEIMESHERTFTDHERSLAQLLANQAASAIENARLYAEVRQWVGELTTLNKIGQAITSTLDLRDTLTLITDHTIQLLCAAAASVALRDEANGSLWFVAASGAGSDFVRDKRLGADQGIVGWTMQHGQPVLVPDVAQDPRFCGDIDAQSGFKTHSILCIPLQTKGKTIGVIEVLNKAGTPFNQDDLRLLSSLAAPAATAIENARLYKQAQQEIKERKRAEASLEAERASLARRVAERTAELREANIELAKAAKAKDQFVSNVSHELRTPLSVLTLLAGNMDMLYDRWDDETRRQTVRDIRGHARLLNDLVESVLQISRIDCECIPPERRPLDLAQLLCDEANNQRPLAQKNSQTLRVRAVENLVVSGDEDQLRRAIRNLLNNAIKYTHSGGKILCECRVQNGDFAPEDEWPGANSLPAGLWAALRVADTGTGINMEHLPKVFDRFYRVNVQGNVPGVGLGLSIAKELVELHEGHIAASSTPGKGSVFVIYLPIGKE